MAYRAFGVRLVLLAAFALVVVLLQILAVSRLSVSNSPPRPWEYEYYYDRAEKGERRTTPLEHENPGGPDEGRATESYGNARNTARNLERNLQGIQEHMTQFEEKVKTAGEGGKDDQIAPPPSTAVKETVTAAATTSEKTQQTKFIPSLSPMPLPPDLKNCDLQSKKDAQSALSRAKTEECKALIRNITCLGQAGRLYDRSLENSCHLGRSDPGKPFQEIPISHGTGPPARVVFLLSVHGRPFRQVKRLLKAIYHTDHYYFIHVDSRSDYLHRKLYEAVSHLPNVYFPTWRMATIWGGASLLQMLLRALEDLEFVLTDWNWDFFINLSESDYPIKTNQELVRFLRVHRGSNFVKTHGGDINKFIQKQGLDRTFVECDNHMWRVDNRELPPDITLDGGSDWIAINRNYSRYLVTDKSPFLTGLKRYYEFSLLPAESFFHTVIRNGPMCDTFVKTNLRVTNWNRKLGCRCQYKHIVDWCGCSPNDFLTRDMARLKNTASQHFFARKFEAIINQEVIKLLDAHLYGPYPGGTLALNYYWESIFHVDDDITKPSNAQYTTYQSFLRRSLKLLYSEQAEKAVVGGKSEDCKIPKQAVVKEVTLLRMAEQFSGLVVTLKDALSSDLHPPEFEVFFEPVSYLKKQTLNEEMARRIWSLEIGANWDGKESVLRSYGNILGVWDEPVAAVRMTLGRLGSVNVIWEDPVGDRLATYTMKVEANWFVAYHKPKVERPIRPGVWKVKLESKSGELLMETKFLVAPLTHENMEPLSHPKALNARKANTAHPGIDSREFLRWNDNVAKEGTALEEWLDELVGEFWTAGGYCRTGNAITAGSPCSWITDCNSTDWSTFSPDPKSEIGKIKPNGRIR